MLIFAIEVDEEDGESAELLSLFALLPALSTPRENIPLVSFPLTTSPIDVGMSIVWNCSGLWSVTLSEELNPLARGRMEEDEEEKEVSFVHVSSSSFFFFVTQSPAFGCKASSVVVLSVASWRMRFEDRFNRNRSTWVCFRVFDISFELNPSPAAKDMKTSREEFYSYCDYVKWKPHSLWTASQLVL